MPIAAIFAEEAAAALAAELAPYAAGEAALAAGTVLGAEALMGLGAEALGTSAIGGAEAALTADAMAANAAAGGAGAGGAGINAAQVAAQQNAAMQTANAANAGITGIPQVQTFPVEGFQPAPLSNALANPTMAAQPPMGLEGQFAANQFIEPGSAGIPSMENTIAQANIPVTPPSALEVGMDKAIKFAEKNPFTAMTLAYTGANALGLLNPSGATFNDKPYDGPLSRYRLASDFQGRTANPLDFQYKPRYATGGGIMSADPYSIPVGYGDGGDVPSYAEGDLVAPPALPYPSRTTRSSDTFRVPGAPYDPAQVAAADAYNDILRNRVLADTQSGRANDPMYGVSNPSYLEQRANTPERGFGPFIAQNELLKRSGEGEYAVPGFGDLGQFAGSFDPANVPMGNNRYSPVDQYKMIAQDTAVASGTAPFMPRDGGAAARANLAADSNDGRFAVPGLGDLGQFAGSFNSLKDDNPYNVDAYAKGGSLSESISEYQRMLSGQTPAAPAASRDVGIYYDQDPDTRYQDALTAAQIRQAKVNQRAYVSPPVAKRPTPMGKLNLPTSGKSKDSSSGDVEAASGGIMHSSLGGYAAGGNPRLLKGPGDGMSDNIPATINGRQPARLADGEFVVPADVVSHLGNGSTDAGAKQLHAMMDKVRKARTGNQKQGKQIKPQKYLPK